MLVDFHRFLPTHVLALFARLNLTQEKVTFDHEYALGDT